MLTYEYYDLLMDIYDSLMIFDSLISNKNQK